MHKKYTSTKFDFVIHLGKTRIYLIQMHNGKKDLKEYKNIHLEIMGNLHQKLPPQTFRILQYSIGDCSRPTYCRTIFLLI